MVKTIRIDKRNNRLIDFSNGKLLDRYDPQNPNLHLEIKMDDGSILSTPSKYIIQEYGGQVAIYYCDDKFIIDDGYQDVLINAGYIVYKNYDVEKEPDKEKGYSIRNKIISDIRDAIDQIGEHESISDVEYSGDQSRFKITCDDDFEYTFSFNTVNSIVNKNQIRKNNSLPFYPFSKKMDKYGTVYLSVFARKKRALDEFKGKEKYNVSKEHIDFIMNSLGDDYHYDAQNIKRRLLMYKGI